MNKFRLLFVAVTLTVFPFAVAAQDGKPVGPNPPAGLFTITGALKGNGSGTISQAVCADLSNAAASCSTDTTNAANISTGTIPAARLGTTATAWTPVDNSGASLVFTGVSAHYDQIGNMVFAYAQLTFPSTANGATFNLAGLPVVAANANYAKQCNISSATVTTLAHAIATAGSTSIQFTTSAGLPLTNASMSLTTINFMCIYPAS